jgi:HPt (histidine-containing phosphotransfer) domain-containing protein
MLVVIGGFMGDEIWIDQGEALQRLGGSHALLKRVLVLFVDQWSLIPQSWRNQRPTLEELEREIHTLKGVAANLSAKVLFGSCKENLESLHQRAVDDTSFAKLLEDLEQTLKESERLIQSTN